MPWTIEVEERDHIVRVVSDGPMRLVTIRQASAEAMPGILEDLGLRKADRVAVVYSKSSPKRSDFEFFENVAYNRGFSVQLFTDPEKAREWLNAR